MNARIKQLRDLVVALDRADRNIEPMAPDAYQAAARTALTLTSEEMGLLPIGDFAGPVSALQSMAENIFFGVNGCFADLDGTGRAPVALTSTRERLRRGRKTTSAGASREITDNLMKRLRATPAVVEPGFAVAKPAAKRSRAGVPARLRGDRFQR
jgi:hypothetical protein